MSEKAIIFLVVTSLLGGCHGSTPKDLAQVVLMEEIGQLDGVRMGFVPCASVDSLDVDVATLKFMMAHAAQGHAGDARDARA